MPSQEYAPPECALHAIAYSCLRQNVTSFVPLSADTSLSPSESGNVNKRKAPEDNFASDEEVFCPCNVGPCIILTSAKPHSQGRKFYRCPKNKVPSMSAIR